ncbi:MAG: hypothetical protein EYX74_02120 [Desulfobulbaceae bacterium]|nr:MAG: hypothetical protein EYX74_02120 [Desulfobulbaceae bacterium]
MMNLSKAGQGSLRAAWEDELIALDRGSEPKMPRSDEFIGFADFWQRSHDSGSVGSPNHGDEGLRGFEALRQAPDERELAQQEATRIIAEAREEAIRLQNEARENGRIEGQQQGRAEARDEYADRVASLAKALAEIRGQRRGIMEHYREDIWELVKTLTDRLVYHEVSVNPGVIRDCLREAMGFVVQNSQVKAYVNPDDFSHLKEAGIMDSGLWGGKNRIQLLEDAAVARGGCRLQSSFGEIDATLENRRKKLYHAVELAFKAALRKNDSDDEQPPAAATSAGD